MNEHGQKQKIETSFLKLRAFYESGRSLPLEFRVRQLASLEAKLIARRGELEQALHADLNKSPHESFMTEIGLVLEEIRYIRRHIKKWARPSRRMAGLTQMPASLNVHSLPYGVVLIMAPWNYPLLLSLSPLVGAIAAGNTVVLKPSAYAPASSKILRLLCEESFADGLVEVVEGGREENQALLEQDFNKIFFTGSPAVGRAVMRAAADKLIPLTLELGGKSPCLVAKSARIVDTARRVAFGKLVNAGQTCVAPDYVLVEKEVFDPFVAALHKEMSAVSQDAKYFKEFFPRIINEKHFHRLRSLLDASCPVMGGELQEESLQIHPAILLNPALNSAIMQEEIFGPLLPVLAVNDMEEAMTFVRERPRPLALYLFCNDTNLERKVTETLAYGGGCINDCLVHLSSPRAPFGGIGNSGMGRYHGRDSFLCFSHQKTLVKKAWFGDLPLRYHPYSPKKEKCLRRLLGGA